MPDDILVMRKQLWANGYRPVAVKSRGKEPEGKAWQIRARKNPPEAATMIARAWAASTGMLCDGLRAIDIDVTDAVLANEIEYIARDMIGLGPVRGRPDSAKRLILYRAKDGEPRKRKIGGVGKAVEALGFGQQFVAFGTHPDGAEYEWRDTSPLTMVRDDLPAIDEDDLTAFMDAAARALGVPTEADREAVKAQPVAQAVSNQPRSITADDRLRKYAADTMDRVASDLASTTHGGRNDALNAAAMRMGGMGARGWVHINDVHPVMLDACQRNGLLQSDGGAAFEKTFWSGWHAGMRSPARDPVDREPGGDLGNVVIMLRPRPMVYSMDGNAAIKLVEQQAIEASPFQWCDPDAIPPREWLYGKHYIRGFVSSTVAPGGVGKSALTMCEAIAVATGRDLLGTDPDERVPVWVMNLEDPQDELLRRTLAIALRYGLKANDLEGWLHLNSGRDRRVVVAEHRRDGTVIARPVVDAIKAEAQSKGIGLIVVDPFVASHAVPENDNGAINAVVSAWREIAEECKCAIELVHHTRKTGGGEVTVEDGRGGSSLHGAVRSMRAINGMTEEEQDRAGVDNRRLYFRVDAGKSNLSPPADSVDWYKLDSVGLGNDTPCRPQDFVGVVAKWRWPNAMDGINPDQILKVQQAIHDGEWRKDVQSPTWVGHVVSGILNLNMADKKDKGKVSTMLRLWERDGLLKVEFRPDEKSKMRAYFIVGRWIDDRV